MVFQKSSEHWVYIIKCTFSIVSDILVDENSDHSKSDKFSNLLKPKYFLKNLNVRVKRLNVDFAKYKPNVDDYEAILLPYNYFKGGKWYRNFEIDSMFSENFTNTENNVISSKQNKVSIWNNFFQFLSKMIPKNSSQLSDQYDEYLLNLINSLKKEISKPLTKEKEKIMIEDFKKVKGDFN